MSLIRLTKSTHGKDAIIDNNYHKHTFNSTGKNVNYWTCANRSCKARISTRKSTGNLVGQSIPLHDHDNQLLIKKAKEHENMANHQRFKLLDEQFGVLPDKEYLQQVALQLQKSD